MAIAEWRRPCPPDCTCGKHSPRTYTCKDGCTCARHSDAPSRRKCEPGCTCTRHRSRACAPGCTCARHGAQANRKHTEEQAAAARERKLAAERDRMKQRRQEPGFLDAERAYRKANPDLSRNHFLRHKFGLSVDLWNGILIAQSGRCYLCSDPLDPAHIHVDHSHACCPGNRSCGNCVRGLACRWCNQGVGQFRDDPERMRRAATALEQAEAKIMAL